MIVLKCPMCGGTLDVDETLTIDTCKYCDSKIIIPDKNEDVDDTVQFQIERLLKNAETFKSLGQLKESRDYYSMLIKEYPDEYRGWWGMLLLDTNNFQLMENIDTERANKYAQAAFKMAPENKSEELRTKFNTYISQYDEHCRNEAARKHLAYNSVLKEYNECSNNLEAKKMELNNQKLPFNLSTSKITMIGIISVLLWALSIYMIINAIDHDIQYVMRRMIFYIPTLAATAFFIYILKNRKKMNKVQIKCKQINKEIDALDKSLNEIQHRLAKAQQDMQV